MDYEIIRSHRKTVAIQIKPDGKILVRCPQRMKPEAIRAFVQSKAGWIEKHLAGRKPQTLPQFTSQQLATLREQTRVQVTQRAAYYAPLVGVRYNRIAVRAQHTRWGSCSAQGNLNFNCLLALAPAEVLDYVVVHELCHRKELNHSAAFWAEVARILPDYKLRQKWLKDHGPGLIARLSGS